MINIFLAFIILLIAMYLAIKVLDVVNARFNLLPKPDVIRPQTKIEMAGGALDYIHIQEREFSPLIVHHVVNVGEVDAGAVGSEVIANAEGLAEGVQAVAESAGEILTTFVEGLSHH